MSNDGILLFVLGMIIVVCVVVLGGELKKVAEADRKMEAGESDDSH